MSTIKPKGTFDSFNLAPEGKNTYVFNGDVIPTSTGSLRFVCEYENDPSAKVGLFGGVNSISNLENLMGIIYFSGVGYKIKKKKPALPDPKDGWDEGILKNGSLIEQLKIDIRGCRIILDIKHIPAKWKDSEGKEQTGFNARCQEMFLVESGAGTYTPFGEKQENIPMDFS